MNPNIHWANHEPIIINLETKVSTHKASSRFEQESDKKLKQNEYLKSKHSQSSFNTLTKWKTNKTPSKKQRAKKNKFRP